MKKEKKEKPVFGKGQCAEPIRTDAGKLHYCIRTYGHSAPHRDCDGKEW